MPCKQCGVEHYNFQSCEQGKAAAEKAAIKPDMFTRPRDGERTWGNSFNTFQGREKGSVIYSFIPREEHPLCIKVSPPEAA